MTTPHQPVAVRLIVVYKAVKAVAQAAAAVLLFVGAAHGLGTSLAAFAERLRAHAVHGGHGVATTALARFGDGRHALHWVAAALGADAILSAFEGWALGSGKTWGPWLVVVATASLVPFEIVALVRHPHVARAAVLAVNLAIVLYLAGRVRRDQANSRP
jgi:uncharacterized membrane protein (DUF2068 family)